MDQFSLLDLDNDVLNIIGDYVKKDNLKRELRKEEQILKGKRIRFPSLSYCHQYILFDENEDLIKLRIP
jgi:hypothetical protein